MIHTRLYMRGKSAVRYLLFLLGLRQAHSQTSQAERECLARHAKDKRCAVQIGTYQGVDAAIILQQLSSGGILYCLDHYQPGMQGFNWDYRIAKRFLKPVDGRKVQFVPLTGATAVPRWDIPIDFLFIYGDHSRKVIDADWRLFAPKIVPDGSVALHGTQVPSWNPGRRNLASESYMGEVISKDPRFEVVETVDSLTVLRQRGDREGRRRWW